MAKYVLLLIIFFIHESKRDELIEKMRGVLKTFYGEDVSSSPDYMRMINNHHFQRVKAYLDNSVAKGAKIVIGGKNKYG